MEKLEKDNPIRQLEKARRRFNAWRASRKSGARGRIPERLWRLAAALAAEHGIDRTRKALGLNHTSLKQRVEKAGMQRTPKPTFMELPGSWLSASGSVVEIESAAGAKMRVQLANGQELNVAELARDFWAGRR